MRNLWSCASAKLTSMVTHIADTADRAILRQLVADPAANGVSIAERTGLARNTVRARMQRLESDQGLTSFEHRIPPAMLGYPVSAFVTTTVVQQDLDSVAAALAAIPEVLEVSGVAGGTDLLIRIVAHDPEDLYRIAGTILSIRGVVRTETGIVMRQLVPYRVAQLLDQR